MKVNRLDIVKLNQISFVIIVQLFLTLILYKVFHVPIVQDETATTAWYCQNYSAWEIMMFPGNSPNNHILNTLLVKLILTFFDPEQWLVRLPNVLFFIGYFFAVYRLLENTITRKSVFYVPVLILFFSNFFLQDFFGLSRGYGLAVSLCTLSISYLVTGFKLRKNAHIWLGFVFSILASYANFTVLVYWCTATIIAAGYFFMMNRLQKTNLLKPLIILVVACLLYAALIANPIIKMQSTDQFQYWTRTGFFNATILHSVSNALYDASWSSMTVIKGISYLIVIASFLSLFIVIKRFVTKEDKTEVLFTSGSVVTMALFITAGVNILQCEILGTPNLTARTALFYYPLFISVLLPLFKVLDNKMKPVYKRSIAITLTIFLLFHTAFDVNLKMIPTWPTDQNNLEVINYLKIANNNQKISLKTHWFNYTSFKFYKFAGKTPFIDLKGYDQNIDPETDADYYYIRAKNYNELKDKFQLVYKFNIDGWLLKRRDTLLNYDIIEEFDYKKERINDIMEEMKNNPKLFRQVKKKASQRNIPLDSMIYLDAVWIFKHQ